MFFKCINKMGCLRRMFILKAKNVVSEGIPIVYVYQMHQQNGSFAQNVDSEDIPGSTNGVNRKARNNKLDGDRAPPTSTNVLIYKMGWPSRLQIHHFTLEVWFL